MLFDEFDMVCVKKYLEDDCTFDEAVQCAQDDIVQYIVVDTLEDAVRDGAFAHLSSPIRIEDFDSMPDNSGFTFSVNDTKWQVKMEKICSTQEQEKRHTRRVN